jgi:23S rRNA (uracil1939-C5)-methyltransferase
MRKGKVRLLRDVEVTGYASEGKSLARVDGKVCFIEGAVPGDRVDVRVSKSKKDWMEGRAVAFHSLSADRTDPFCDHFGTCGGCKWQMLPYEHQLKYKRQEVIEHMRRIGGLDIPEVPPIIGSQRTEGYRNKLEFTFSNRRYLTAEEMADRDPSDVTSFEPALGFHVPRWFDKVVDIGRCHLMDEPVNAIKNWIRDRALERGYSFYDMRAHRGWLRNLVFRLCTTGDLMVNLVLGHEDAEWENLLSDLAHDFPAITSLYGTVNPKMNDSIHDLVPVLFKGKSHVIERLCGLDFRIGPKSFFQTNTAQAEKLYGIAKRFACLQGGETVYDLYCGTGSIGLCLAEKASSVVGVEVVGEAVADARENARINGIGHARFFAGDVIEVCDDGFFLENGRPDVIVTDPPRAGMHEKLIRKILEIGAKRVVYVSCNPATQARDLARLAERYRVTDLQPVDMFPHTHHIENVAGLELSNL